MTFIDINGPHPPAGKDFCSYCIMEYKARIVVVHIDRINELQADGLDAIEHWDLRELAKDIPGLLPPRIAVGIGMVQNNPQWGFLKLCWVHLATVGELAGLSASPKGLAVAHGDVDSSVAALRQPPGIRVVPARPGER